jgi:hypothetical protein
MIRRLPFVLGIAAFGAALQARGSEPELMPIIRFGSGVRALATPIDNPTAEPIDLVVRVDDEPRADGDEHSLSGRGRVRPGEAGALILPLQATGALLMSMRTGPPPEARWPDAPVRVIGGAQGAGGRRHVKANHLILLTRSSGRTLILGDLGIVRGADPGPEAYRSIVDGFGQYTRARWDGKIASDDCATTYTTAGGGGAGGLPPAMGLDRYGGLQKGPNFAATGLFRTERRGGRWWLVTPDGHGFFSLGIDVVSAEVGATFVEGREFMFVGVPEQRDPLAAHYGHADENLLEHMRGSGRSCAKWPSRKDQGEGNRRFRPWGQVSASPGFARR